MFWTVLLIAIFVWVLYACCKAASDADRNLKRDPPCANCQYSNDCIDYCYEMEQWMNEV